MATALTSGKFVLSSSLISAMHLAMNSPSACLLPACSVLCVRIPLTMLDSDLDVSSDMTDEPTDCLADDIAAAGDRGDHPTPRAPTNNDDDDDGITAAACQRIVGQCGCGRRFHVHGGICARLWTARMLWSGARERRCGGPQGGARVGSGRVDAGGRA